MIGCETRADREPWPELGSGMLDEATPAPRVRGPAGTCVIGDRFEVFDFFKFNSSALRPFHIAEIRALARRIAASLTTPAPMTRILLVGHTDNRGGAPFNRTLGTRRAQAVAARLKTELGTNASKVTIVIASRGESDPVAPNGIDRGRACNRRVEAFLKGVRQTCRGMSFRRFFTEYDLRFEPGSATIGVPANPGMNAAAKAQRIADVQAIVAVLTARLDARAASARNRPAPAPIPPVNGAALTRLSDAQIALFVEAFPAVSGGLNRPRMTRAFHQFANGELRTPDIQAGVGEPDGGFYFLFAEFAFLCTQRNVRRAIWTAMLRRFVSSQEIFMHVYRRAPHPPPPAVNAPLPAACDPPRHPISSYSNLNFGASGQTNGVRKGLLTLKYAPMTLAQLRVAARQNLLRAQCQT